MLHTEPVTQKVGALSLERHVPQFKILYKERVGVAVVTISVDIASYPALSTVYDTCHNKNTSF